MRVHKGLLAQGSPGEDLMVILEQPSAQVRTWSALADDSKGPQVSETGEQVWGRYCIQEGSHSAWWDADFRDEDVLVQMAEGESYTVPYLDMRRIPLPDKNIPAMKTASGMWYDESAIEGFTGRQYPIQAAAWARTGDGLVVWRNIYFWHSIVLATYHDRRRNGLENGKGWRD